MTRSSPIETTRPQRFRNTSDRFSPEHVCKVLFKLGLINEGQRREIMARKDRLLVKLEKIRAVSKSSSKVPIGNPVTIVDVIASLQLERANNPARLLDEEIIYQALARAWKIPFIKVDPLKLDLNLVTTTIPHTFARKHLVLPISIEGGCLTVATPDPFNTEVIHDISQVTQMKVKTVVSPKTDIMKIINEFFGFKRSIVAAQHQFGAPLVDLGNLEQYVRLRASDELPSNDQHIVNAVDHLFSYAFDQRASDVHLEPKRDKSIVRFRIDGALHPIYEIPKNVHAAVVSRIKTLARLDMAEKRRPQDGRIKMEKGGVESEIRVSCVPVAFGEKIVMRIMDPDVLFQSLEHLGFSAMDLIRYQQMISMPNGIVVVCGPTGSGKSTTLYSTLRYVSTPDVNITTVEDPIEMIHEGFNQIAVQPVIGITFASILKNILRQDPDIIMIGEMRDVETAENAIQAALTGHLVLSTLHTNDAPSSITRLLDLGVPPFLIQATLVGILAQRLIRKICPNCKETFDMEHAELAGLGLDLGREGIVRLHRGKGCMKCRGTGYLGRIGIYEVLPVTEAIRKGITHECDIEVIRDAARKEGMVTLRENAVKKLMEGKTSYQEVLRVTWEHL
jgi:general secretion pathway protein E